MPDLPLLLSRVSAGRGSEKSRRVFVGFPACHCLICAPCHPSPGKMYLEGGMALGLLLLYRIVFLSRPVSGRFPSPCLVEHFPGCHPRWLPGVEWRTSQCPSYRHALGAFTHWGAGAVCLGCGGRCSGTAVGLCENPRMMLSSPQVPPVGFWVHAPRCSIPKLR